MMSSNTFWQAESGLAQFQSPTHVYKVISTAGRPQNLRLSQVMAELLLHTQREESINIFYRMTCSYAYITILGR